MKKKLLKLILLMILLVSSYLRGYAQIISSTGEIIRDDTTKVIVPIKYIRLANEKLIERNYLLEANAYKDSIIIDYKNYIKEQERINKEYINKVNDNKKLVNDLNKRLERQKKTSLILGGVAGASIITVVLIAIVN